MIQYTETRQHIKNTNGGLRCASPPYATHHTTPLGVEPIRLNPTLPLKGAFGKGAGHLAANLLIETFRAAF